MNIEKIKTYNCPVEAAMDLYPVVPPKTEYSLTEFGQSLVPIVQALCDWGEHYFEVAGVPVPCE